MYSLLFLAMSSHKEPFILALNPTHYEYNHYK